jgi:predicted nucleic acid-binding protein
MQAVNAALEHDVDEAVETIKHDRARKKATAIGVVIAGIVALFAVTYAAYTYTPGKASAGQIGTVQLQE